MGVAYNRLGGRTIELLIPFECMGRKIEAITLKPIVFDHVLRWQQGAFPSSLALLGALSGENESTLRMLRYPDVDRVLGAMMDMLPDGIRNDITSGVVPQAKAPPQSAAVNNGLDLEPPPANVEEPFIGLNDK